MKFVMVSKYGEGSGVLYRIAQEGNDVQLYITEKENRKIYNGLIPKVDSLPTNGDCYIFDVTGNGKIADQLKKEGKCVIGGSSFADNIEENREDGIELMKAIDLEIPQTEFFKNYSDAKDFLAENDDKLWVFKPCGRGLPTKLTYKGDDIEQMYRYLTYVEKEFKADQLEFLLQEFVEGIAVSTEGWFNGENFIFPFNHTIENKKYGVDNLGPSTGCEGDIVWSCDDDPIVQTLLKLEPILASEQYCGPIDVNCIVNEKGFYGLEWTPRFGYDATPTLLKLFNDDIGKFFMEMESLPIDECFAGSIRVSIPPYPLEVLENEKMPHTGGIPIDGIEDEGDYYFYEVMKGEDGLVHAGGVGLICCTLSTSSNYDNVLDDSYKLAKDLRIPDKYYRTDLQKVLSKDYEKFDELTQVQSEKETN
jgi:phosphoribosylamine--glycine ligase